MNDDIREKLSAYLDGALSDAERRAVEVEISRSEDMRLELEALRAVSSAVKGLPREKLPDGFMARLEARRLRDGSKPARPYFILPPAYRPVAFALSSAIVALVVWDKNHVPADPLEPKVGWESKKVAMKSAAEAPASIDVSGKLSSLGAGGAAGMAKDEAFDGRDAKEDSSLARSASGSTFGKHLNAPGKPVEVPEDVASAPQAPAAAAAPAATDALEPNAENGAFNARNEEERSAINERLYKGLEAEKKRMGIARILEPESDADKKLSTGGREMLALQAAPENARADGGRANVAAMRGASPAAKMKREAAPVKALALRSADALYTAWAAAGLPGGPPAVKFPGQMAIFLAGPQGSGIVSVQNRKKLIVVLYKDSGFDDPSARVRAVAFSAKPVVVKLVE
jgi:anti-sigma factor RsiW